MKAENEMTGKEMMDIIRERPEILRLLRAYDAVPEARKAEAYATAMRMLKEQKPAAAAELTPEEIEAEENAYFQYIGDVVVVDEPLSRE